MDAVVVFHRLRADHLPPIIDRQVAVLTELLAHRRVLLMVDESARHFLIEKGIEGVRFGARQLGRVLRRFLEFPLGDRLVSGHLVAGQRVTVRAEEGELAFDISPEPMTSIWPPMRTAEVPWAGARVPGAAASLAPTAPAPAAWAPPSAHPLGWPPAWPQLPAAAGWPSSPYWGWTRRG
jgi:hypothetical protein